MNGRASMPASHQKIKIINSLLLILVWICMGLYIEIFGPTLKDLQILFDTDVEPIARAVSARGLGGFLGSFTAGVLADKRPDWLGGVVTVSNTIGGAAALSVPFAPSPNYMWGSCFMIGVGVGAVNVAGQRQILMMWREKAPTPTHAAHMGFGIGAFIIPLMANPFLTDSATAPSNATTASSTSSTNSALISASNTTHQTTVPLYTTNINVGNDSTVTPGVILASSSQSTNVKYAFIIVAVITFTLSLSMGLFQYLTRGSVLYNRLDQSSLEHSRPLTFREMVNPRTYVTGPLWYGTTLFVLVCLFFINVVGGEQMFGTFIRTYSVDLLHFTKDQATYLNMLFWLAFTFGRFSGSVLSHFFHIKHLITIQVLITFISVIVLNSIRMSPSALWAFTAIQGMLYAPLFPMGVSIVNTVMDVKGVCVMVMAFSASIGDLGYMWVGGRLFDRAGPGSIMYAMLFSSVLIFVTVLVFRLITHGKERVAHVNSDLGVLRLDGELDAGSAHAPEEATGLLSSEDEL